MTVNNSKFDRNAEEFIGLRIAGNSFDSIAKKLKVAKSTLIEWNKKKTVREAIKEGKAIKINGIVKAYKYDRANKLETFLKLSEKLNKELLKRDLSEVNTTSLLKMSIDNDSRIKKVLGGSTQIGDNEMFQDIGHDRDGFFNLQPDE